MSSQMRVSRLPDTVPCAGRSPIGRPSLWNGALGFWNPSRERFLLGIPVRGVEPKGELGAGRPTETQPYGSSAVMRSSVRRPIRLMAGLLST